MATLTHHQENIACFEHFDLLTVGPVAKPATLAPRNTQPKPNAPKVRTALDESRTLFEEELAGWIEMHIMSPFQHIPARKHVQRTVTFRKGQNQGRPFFSPHPTRGQWQATVPQADVETATLQPKQDQA